MKRFGCFALILILLLSGCSGYQEPCAVSDKEADGAHYYEIKPRNCSAATPMVILLHGLGGKKEELLDAGKYYAGMGYFVIVPDLAGHGENVSSDSLTIFDIIRVSAENCETIISSYRNSSDVDADSYALAGISAGGMTSLYISVHAENPPACVAALYATPDFESLIGRDVIYQFLREGTFYSAAAPEMRQTIDQQAKEYNPLAEVEKMKEIPILFINGEADPIIPLEGIKAFFSEALALGIDVKQIIHAGQGHELAEGDIDEISLFWQEHLPMK